MVKFWGKKLMNKIAIYCPLHPKKHSLKYVYAHTHTHTNTHLSCLPPHTHIHAHAWVCSLLSNVLDSSKENQIGWRVIPYIYTPLYIYFYFSMPQVSHGWYFTTLQFHKGDNCVKWMGRSHTVSSQDNYQTI